MQGIHKTNIYSDCDCGGLITFRGSGPGSCNKCGTAYVMVQQGDTLSIRPLVTNNSRGLNFSQSMRRRPKPKALKHRQPLQTRAQLSWSMRRNIVAVLLFVAIAVTVVTNMGG